LPDFNVCKNIKNFLLESYGNKKLEIFEFARQKIPSKALP
jgi:hypothetical protein